MTIVVLIFARWFIPNYLNQDDRLIIYYQSWDKNNQVQLYRITLGERGPTQLTNEDNDIQSFALSPNGRSIAFSTNKENAISNIWLIDNDGHQRKLIISCFNAICDQLVWPPDGRRLAYEKREIGDDGIPSFPRLWWIDTQTGETIPILEESQAISQRIRFSPDGKSASYVGSPDEGIFIYNFETGQTMKLPGELGTPAIWSPDGQSVLTRNNQLVVLHGSEDIDHLNHSHNFSLGVYLFLTNIINRETTTLSGDGIVDDGSPVWSPDGQWIAFGRKIPETTMGRQIWLVRPDGRQAHSLTDVPNIHHGLPTWSQDGRYLIFQRFDTQNPEQRPGIWLIDVKSGQEREIITPGFQPQIYQDILLSNSRQVNIDKD